MEKRSSRTDRPVLNVPVLSTRLFPKGQGADAMRVTGLAARCDWVVLSDHVAPKTHLHRNRDTDDPRHIFLSLRAPFDAILFFAETLLPRLRSDFVLITGSEDATLPRQLDARWRRFNDRERAALDRILAHPRLVHWYAENLDRGGVEKRSPIPLGMVFPDGPPPHVPVPDVPPLSARDLRVFAAHRTRVGPQWSPRRQVSALVQGPWRSFCTAPPQELSEPAFMAEIGRHVFVLCVEGGGLDPSPKAWSALLHGAIPIIRRTAVSPAYAHLPVAIVPDWTADTLSPARLEAWHARLCDHFETPEQRARLLHRLTLDYWWDLIARGTPIAAPMDPVAP